MRAAHTYPSNGSKATKIAIVTLLHVGVALALINMKMIVKNAPDKGPITVTLPTPTVTPPEPTPVDLTTKKIDTTVFVPKTVIDVAPPPETVIAKVLPPGPPPEKTDGGTRTGGGGEAKVAVVAPKTFVPALANANDCARPDYPASAARLGETGTVTLALLIGADGRVADAKVSNTSGSKVLDRAAIAALSLCKFKPATSNGVAEPAWGKIAYAWSLD